MIKILFDTNLLHLSVIAAHTHNIDKPTNYDI